MRHGTPAIAALGRSLNMLEAILTDREGRSVSAIAAEIGVPRATAHRQVATLLAERFLVRLPSGKLGPGPRLLALVRVVDEAQMVVAAAAPVLHRLAAEVGCVCQLGTLDNDMVTYRIKSGQGAGDFFTKVGLQLEAYCTGIGKVLLAHLAEAEREAYLATGPFPALTARTITESSHLREELARVRAQGFARDDEEIAEGLSCLAVPIQGQDRNGGRIVAAISVSISKENGSKYLDCEIIKLLFDSARQIESDIGADR